MNSIIGQLDLREAETTDEVATCFALMAQLRPHLTSAEDFVARWQRLAPRYRLLTLKQDGTLIALAGFRLDENLFHGRFLYVDDLVTDEAKRGGGYGKILLDHLVEIGRVEECTKIVLDTPLSNVLGHRFYYRQGMLATSLRFNLPLAERAAPLALSSA